MSILCALTAIAMPMAARADEASFRALFKTLVETDTTTGSGHCTVAADKAAAAMTAGGFPAADLHAYAASDHPADGGLVAILPGSARSARPLLLVAHIDTVDAARADWSTDPFRLTEKDGYFYGRGVSDNKAMAAALIDMLVRFHTEGFRPRRTIKVALTCGEESAAAFNGARYLAMERRDLIDAGLALVPSGGGTLDRGGHKVSIAIQAGEKTQQNFRLEALGTGSHASRPTANNAIYLLSAALVRLSAYAFPVVLNDATRRYFARMAITADAADASAIRALLANPADVDSAARLSTNPAWNGMLRTTCVSTIIQGGSQLNTVETRASANVNCRLLPGETIEHVRDTLVAIAASPTIAVMPVPPVETPAPSPPLTPAVTNPLEAVTAAMWPGVAIIPTMLTGATDGRHLNAVGIPTYGLTALFNDPDGNGVHAANERVRVESVLEGREFIYRLVKRYGEGGG